MKWVRYRFKTKAKDYRPIVFNPSYPWWCSGSSGDNRYSTIVAYLPKSEPLKRYWDDASCVDADDCDGPSFSDRFPMPAYYVPLDAKALPEGGGR